MAQGLGQLSDAMGQGMDGSSVSDAELLAGLSKELDALLQGMRSRGQGRTQGGNAMSDWGIGSTLTRANPTPGTNAGERSRRDVADKGNERTAIDFVPSYDPEQIPSDAYNTRVRGKVGSGGETLAQEMISLPSKADSLSEYYDIVAAYGNAAEQAMENENIPPEYRELVKSYFETISDPKDNLVKSAEDDESEAGSSGKSATSGR
ncbi:MAG: hypothetical protein HRF49_10080 [bacterium]|jgi:hypothetical protein